MSINDHEAKEKEYIHSTDPVLSTDNPSLVSPIAETSDEASQQSSSQNKKSLSEQDVSVQKNSVQTTGVEPEHAVSHSDNQSDDTLIISHEPLTLSDPVSYDPTLDLSLPADPDSTLIADHSDDVHFAQPVETAPDSNDITPSAPDQAQIDSASSAGLVEPVEPVEVPFAVSISTSEHSVTLSHSLDVAEQDEVKIPSTSSLTVDNEQDDDDDDFQSTAKRPAVVVPPKRPVQNTPVASTTSGPEITPVSDVSDPAKTSSPVEPVAGLTPAANRSSVTPPRRPTAKSSGALSPTPAVKPDVALADTVIVNQSVTPPRRPTAKPDATLPLPPVVDPVITPPERPQANQVITPNQEKGSRYLTWKRSLKDHLTIPMPVIKSNNKQQHDEKESSSVDLIAAQNTTQLVIPNTPPLQRPASTPPPSGRRDLAYAPRRALGMVPASSFADSYPRRSGKPLTSEELRHQHRKRVLLRHISRRNMRDDRMHGRRGAIRVWVTLLTIVAVFVILFFSVAGAGSYISYQFYNNTQSAFLPKVLDLHDLMPKDNLKIYDSNQTLLTQETSEGVHTTVPYEQIAPGIINATIATEDKNFWTNPGIDVNRILQSLFDDLRHGSNVEGGSTITQQLVKNLVLGDQNKTYIRKLQELAITPEVNSHYSKKDIMSMYLNSIYYGEQAYGVDAAATRYFGLEDQPGGKSAAAQLDIAQSAMLAGIPNSPVAYDPLLHPKTAYNRFTLVLQFMLRNGYINRLQQIDALNEANDPNFYKTSPTQTVNRAPHFTQLVLTELEQKYNMNLAQVARSGFSVTTTLDMNLQDKIQKIAQQDIAAIPKYKNVGNAAEVIIDPHTGAIRTLLGSLDYNNTTPQGQGQVDVTQSYRQPGSSFKPFVYLAAFEGGASPAQAVDDSKLVISQAGAAPYIPGNYSNTFSGHMTLRCALQNSLNIPAIKVLQHVGIDKAMSVAKSMGINSTVGYAGYSLVLGGLGVKLLDETSAYGTFANGGKHIPYYAIEKVVNMNTNKIDQHQLDPGTQATSPQDAYMMTSVLSDNTSRLPEFLECNVLQLYTNSKTQCNQGNRGTVIPAAVKTGTTNNFRDNWTVGYTSDYVMGVWAGNNNNEAMQDILGVDGAAPIWHDGLLAAEQGKQPHDFVNPGGLEKAAVTYTDGVSTTDWFIPGTEPRSAKANPAAKADIQAITAAENSDVNNPPNQPDSKQPKKSVAPLCATYSYAFGPTGSDPLSGINPNPGPDGWW